jgi:hypothetical protein
MRDSTLSTTREESHVLLRAVKPFFRRLVGMPLSLARFMLDSLFS